MSNITIRPLREADIDSLCETFAEQPVPPDRLQHYYLEQLLERRLVFVAIEADQLMGYATLLLESRYTQFWRRNIPEIVDLNVAPQHRRRGAGTALIQACEAAAALRGYETVGISVVQDDPEYAAARQLYPTLGYEPDGFGVTAYDNELHLIKKLSEQTGDSDSSR